MTITNENYETILNVLEADHVSFGPDDILEFRINDEVLKYLVHFNFLECLNGNNGRIFRVLDIADKYAFCEEIYGHRPKEGYFPESRENHGECMVKIARALFDLCTEKSVSIETVSTIELKNSSILNGLQEDVDIKREDLDMWLDSIK